MTSRAASIGASVTAALTGLAAAWAYLWRRPARGVRPRIGMAGVVEFLSLSILIASLVAASMILLDPLVPGLRLSLPLGVVHFFERITDLGLGGVVLWPVGLCLLLVLGLTPRLDDMGRRIAAATAARLGFLFISVAGAGLLVLVMKYVLGRARPYVMVHLSGPNAQLTFDWLAMKSGYASFPSGHSAIVFASAVAFAALFPRARAILIALAVLVASSRVVLGSHYPSDVLAGGAIAAGFTLAMVKVFAARRLVFSVAADGAISPKPGPTPRRLARLVPPSAPEHALKEARP
ncbi:phosphatase PAP2 family protein [Aquabacter sp. CN5-332]|uniref:phosphatase PAP2 family protein n=1 Tax=Aquabacter sp. CN5-332 TaxID=3156608 RepID=UPI0032B34F68